MGAGWRGRPSPKPHRTEQLTFCGPCGDLVLAALEPFGGQRLRLEGRRAAGVEASQAEARVMEGAGEAGGEG
jgi:hypothetical protein